MFGKTDRYGKNEIFMIAVQQIKKVMTQLHSFYEINATMDLIHFQ